MLKVTLFLVILAVAFADRPDVAATIPDSFWLEIALKQDTMNTRQKLFLSKTHNQAKSEQVVDMGDTQYEFVTIADFNLDKVSVYNGATGDCDISDLGAKTNIVDIIRGVFTDPEQSPWQEDKGMNLFTVNWKSIEGVDDWTHFYFEKDSNKLALFEHYFKESSEDPWITFDVLTPVTQQDFEESVFVNENCPFTTEERSEL